MKSISSACLLFLSLLAVGASVVVPGAKLEKLAGDFAFTEGPTCDGQGNIFFTDQPNDRILKWSGEGKLSTFLQPAGRANGLAFDAKRNLIACADEHNELWSIAPDKTVTVLAKDFEGQYLNGPNDVWIAPNGGIYLSDPYYQRPWWQHKTKALKTENVFLLTPDRKKLLRVTEDLLQPNGLTGTPDGQRLYVADIRAGQTWRYDILPDGALTNKTFFCAKGSDGMTIDEEENIYLTGGGVTVFDKTGKQIEQIDVPEKWTANVCFGGPEHKTLFITASKSLFSIALRVRGANPAK